MTTRRTRLAALVLLPVLLLAGCGQDDPSAQSSEREPAAPEPTPASGLPAPEARIFSKGSPWNQRVDGSSVDKFSARMIELARESVGVVEREGDLTPKLARRVVTRGIYINTHSWTTPVVTGGQPTRLICRQAVCGDGDDTLILDIPADVDPDPRYDGWMTVLDPDGQVAYDLWRARREPDGSISYHFMRKWDLSGPGFHEPYVVSARGSGLPLFAGLIRPGELEAGQIEHALAISIPGPADDSFVQPASSTDGNGRHDSLPVGARIRLKADVTLPPARDRRTGKLIRLTPSQQRLADAIVAALRTYGAIVVDRAAVPTLYAQRDVTGNLIKGNELEGLRLDDFEVIEMGPRYPYPPDDARLVEDGAALMFSGMSS